MVDKKSLYYSCHNVKALVEKLLFVIVFFVRAMKRRKPSEKESWEDFEKRVGMKPNAGKESRQHNCNEYIIPQVTMTQINE